MTIFDAVVVCARFQPPHRCHFEAIEFGLSQADRVVVLCFGADESRSLNNPWSTDERGALIQAGLPVADRIEVVFLEDVRYDLEAWARRAESVVNACIGSATKIGVIADRSAGLDRMPLPATWSLIDRACAFGQEERAVRERLLWSEDAIAWTDLERDVPARVGAALRRFSGEQNYAGLRDEAAFIKTFRASWSTAPHPAVFVTIDALVVWSDAALLIQRRHAPGASLWALPGGFVDQAETLADACVRELYEESGLSLDPARITERRVFDAPERSLRGRTVTHVFRFDLDAAAPQPEVRGGDDATQACWVRRDEIRAETMFEDHYAILQVMLPSLIRR